MTDFVFLHGGGQGGWVWGETIAALEARSGGEHRFLALDGPGCGSKRGRETSGMTFDAINAELVGDIVDAGMREVILVGHSQAGLHMPAMVALRPDLFAHLVFVSCMACEDGLTTIEMVGQRIHAGGAAFNDPQMPVRERYRAMFCNDMAPGQADAFLDKLGPDQWPAACYVQKDWAYDHLAAVPVTYVLCEEDAILPVAFQRQFAARLHANATPGIAAGHQAMNTRPGELAALLLALGPG